mgnify:CR=1 FL=1
MKLKHCWTLFVLASLIPALAARVKAQSAQSESGKVKLLRVPNGGLQPQTVMDERGALHLIYFAGEPGEGFGAHEMGACFREAAFVGVRQAGEELMAESELQHGVAEEFEALVVDAGALGLVAHARMREGLGKETELAEVVAEDALKRFHVSLIADVPWVTPWLEQEKMG